MFAHWLKLSAHFDVCTQGGPLTDYTNLRITSESFHLVISRHLFCHGGVAGVCFSLDNMITGLPEHSPVCGSFVLVFLTHL